MTRILSYNILIGGTDRVDKLAKIIGAARPDVVGLIEATKPQVAEELADKLGMQFRLSGQARHNKDLHAGVLSHLPIVDVQVHVRPGVLIKQPLLEVCVEEPGGNLLTVFVAHFTAAFQKGVESDRMRRRELQEILRIMAAKQGMPHVLMGDFNAIAPGEDFKISTLMSYVMDPEQEYLKKYKDFMDRSDFSFVTRSYTQLFKTVPRNTRFSSLADRASRVYAPRASIELLHGAGYVDCYRRMNPDAPGFTYPSVTPAGRIDFIFASPEMAQRLSAACVVVKADGVRGDEASDHLPVLAEFA